MYTYFKSKDELVKAIVLEEQNSALTAHNATYAGSYFDRLCAQVTSCISEIGYPITHQLWVEIMAESARNPELRKRISPVMTSCGKASRGSSGEGIAAGEFRRDINLEEITIIIFALIDGLIARQAINTTFSFKDDLPMFLTLWQNCLNNTRRS
ncbi:TetR family transcriptional regulator C-terminal domain-containing protein [Klebsiella quasipneumoniae]|uniref:TetR family transcriptional regulator C-terminal domain-containing protein n=1 Tax=Klebsiella quasipneumoniae TaxID=1463165 RepID=UPI00388F40A6